MDDGEPDECHLIPKFGHMKLEVLLPLLQTTDLNENMQFTYKISIEAVSFQ